MVVVDLGLMMLLTSEVISVSFYSEREKSDKFCSEALILAWGSFTCRKSTTRDPQLYFRSEGSHTQDFYALKNPSTLAGLNPRTSDPVASMITTGPPVSALRLGLHVRIDKTRRHVLYWRDLLLFIVTITTWWLIFSLYLLHSCVSYVCLVIYW